jgi:hypothetical protein
MSKHLKYLNYVVRHKWFVFVACLNFRQAFLFWRVPRPVMIWRGIIHDWQKFTPAEWTPYVKSFYGPHEYNERPPSLVAAFDKAWLHHIHHGPHHWEYWILREDDGDTKALPMPANYIMEMLADWSGAGKAIHGNPDPHDWYFANAENIVLEHKTRQNVEMLLHARIFNPGFSVNEAQS